MTDEVKKMADAAKKAADDATLDIWERNATFRAVSAIGVADGERLGMIAGQLAKVACLVSSHELNRPPSEVWGWLKKAIDELMDDYE